MHITPPVTSERYDGSHHPRYAKRMTSILNCRSRDLKHRGIFRKHREVIILSIKSLARLKNQVKSLVYKMFIKEIEFHRLFDDILKIVFTHSSGILHGKSADVPAKNLRCRCIGLSIYVIQHSSQLGRSRTYIKPRLY